MIVNRTLSWSPFLCATLGFFQCDPTVLSTHANKTSGQTPLQPGIAAHMRTVSKQCNRLRFHRVFLESGTFVSKRAVLWCAQLGGSEPAALGFGQISDLRSSRPLTPLSPTAVSQASGRDGDHAHPHHPSSRGAICLFPPPHSSLTHPLHPLQPLAVILAVHCLTPGVGTGRGACAFTAS